MFLSKIRANFQNRLTSHQKPSATTTGGEFFHPGQNYFPVNGPLPIPGGKIYITHDSALQLSALFACVRVISSDIAKLPWMAYAKEGEVRRKLPKSNVARLLNVRPNRELGAFSFRETMVAWALTYGNGYAEIERNEFGQPVALWPLSPDRVEPRRFDDGRLYYRVTNEQKAETRLDPMDVFHLHGLGFDGISGYSVVGLAAETLGFGIAAEQYGAAFYGNSANLSTVLEHPTRLSDNAHKNLTESFERFKRRGSFGVWVAEEGMKVTTPGTTQVDAQYVETRQHVVEEVCRWMRVPPQKVMQLKDAHYNNVEQLNIEYVQGALHEWVKRLEEEADYKLIGNRSQVEYTKINLNALLRGDMESRGKFYQALHGKVTINEIRAWEDLDPISGGDVILIQQQDIPLEMAGEHIKQAAQQEAVEPAVVALIDRLMDRDTTKAAEAKKSNAPFDEWVDHYLNGVKRRTALAWRDLAISISIAYGSDVSPETLADVYLSYMREGFMGKAITKEHIFQALKGIYENPV